MIEKKCDICGEVIPDTSLMEHNEATEHFSGFIYKANGVMITEHYDLCSKHIDDVINLVRNLQKCTHFH